MAGTLYIVATPIGNLEDMPPRVAATFGAADFIAAEDTRVTMKLLNYLGLKKPMVSYYEHALQKGEAILQRIEAGESCALCSDAGMPCVSDPGEVIVRDALARGIKVVPIPAASACVTALAVSGQDTSRWVFEGFLPVNRKQKKERLAELLQEKRTVIFYEAPHKLRTTLDDLTAAVKKHASRQESALQSALRAEQWFESICRQLRRVQPAVQEGAAGEAVQGPLPQPSALRADTPLQTLDTFCVLALKTTGKHPGRDELVQLSALKFRRFAPETILTVSIRPEKGLTRYAREAGVTDSMVASAPAAAEVAASIEAFLGERAPLVLFQAEELPFLPAAGIGCAGEGRTVYDVQSLLGKPDGKAPMLAEACRDLFSFTPELGGTEQEALACGLVFCALCDRTLHLTKKSAAR